ncbi:unnamed protein product, partial [Meganyctiphanes norvegica]
SDPARQNNIMKLLVLAALAAVTAAAPQGYAPRSLGSDESFEHISTLRDVRHHEVDGTNSLDFETENGIEIAQSGDSEGIQGSYSFTHPDGTETHLTYVANENGFQPQSSALPVAPAFPHPIPDFVLEQIEFARQQKREESSEEITRRTVSNSYSAPRNKRETAPPAYAYSAPRSADSVESREHISTLRDVRHHEVDGTNSLDFETENGIEIAQSGDSEGIHGSYYFTHPDGTETHLTYVANENGFQPQSSALPVAPAFPHPIPDFVLEQIEFARQQDEAAARGVKSSVRTPSS